MTRYRVQRKGAIVRSASSLQSSKVDELAGGTLVVCEDSERITSAEGRVRLRVLEPMQGWVSEKCLERVEQSAPTPLCAALVTKARALLLESKGPEAFEVADEAVDLVPSDAAAMEVRAEANLARGALSAWLRDLTSALLLCDESDHSRLRIACAEAERLVSSQQQSSGHKADADELYRSGEYAAAARAYVALGDDAMALSNASVAYSRLGLWRCALADATAAAARRPHWAKPQLRRAAALQALARLADARRALVLAVRLSEVERLAEDALARLAELGEPSEEAGDDALADSDYALAVACYGAALPIADDPARVAAKRCTALIELDCVNAAERDARRAIDRDPHWAEAYVRAAEAATAAGRRPEDIYWFRAKAADLEPTLANRRAVVKALENLVSTGWRHSDRTRFARDASRLSTRIWAVSDVHFDHPGALEWVRNIDDKAFVDDVLILPGDLGDTTTAIKLALRALRPKFRRLFYCPGNHCLWIRNVDNEPVLYPDSITKWNALKDLCDALDCDTAPAEVCAGVYVVPLLTWYDAAFDSRNSTGRAVYRFDKFCKWPVDHNHVASVFLRWSHNVLSQCPFDHGTIITFSHFLPRRELPFSHIEGLAQAVGDTRIDDQIRAIKPTPKVHIFGHSHINCNKTINGVTYVQHALGYTQEHGPNTPLLCVYDGKELVCSV